MHRHTLGSYPEHNFYRERREGELSVRKTFFIRHAYRLPRRNILATAKATRNATSFITV